MKAAPERLVGQPLARTRPKRPTPSPTTLSLFDLLAPWAPDEAIRNRILVDNPVALYGFG